jgi:hypothetical protein
MLKVLFVVRFVDVNILENGRVIFTHIGQGSCKTSIGNDSHAPYIGFLVVVLVKDLRSHVKRSARACSEIPVSNLSSNAKVNNLALSKVLVTFKQDVLRFEISVYNSFGVDVVQSLESSLDDGADVVHGRLFPV